MFDRRTRTAVRRADRIRRAMAAVTSLIMTAGLLVAVDAPAQAAPPRSFPEPAGLEPVPASLAEPNRAPEDVAARLAASAPPVPEPVWPT